MLITIDMASITDRAISETVMLPFPTKRILTGTTPSSVAGINANASFIVTQVDSIHSITKSL